MGSRESVQYTMTILTLTFLSLAIASRAISELYAHGKLKWTGDMSDVRFWDRNSYDRKYKMANGGKFTPPNNWYYNFFKIKYKERFPLSATLLVFLTDGYHLMQFFFLVFASLSVSIPLEIGWNEFWEWFLVWSVSHLVHFFTYWMLQKK